MSVEAISWALNEAPDVPPQTVAVLIGLANHAGPDGRGSYPSQPTLARYTRKGPRAIRKDLVTLEEKGLIRRGNQRLTDHLPPDKRPVVWDLAMGPEAPASDRNHRTGRNHSSPRNPSSARNHSSRAGGTTVPAATGTTVPPNRPVEPTTEPLQAPPPTAGPPKGADTAKGTRLPGDFTVTPAMAEWARTNAPTCGTADHEAFCDYWRSIPGARGRKLDWTATWRNWMRRENEKRARPTNTRPVGRPTPDDRIAAIQALKNNLPGHERPLNLIQGELA